MISRRHLLAGFAAGTLTRFASFPLGAPAYAEVGPSVPLLASSRILDVDGRSAKVLGITQADGTHGLVTDVGTPFRVTLRNGLDTETLIHWHGLTPPYRQDGVPGISGPPVAPGGTAHYDFPLSLPGTYWMHSHQGLQEQSLLSAPLIVRPQGGIGDRQEVVMMLHDFAFRSPEEIYAGLRRGKGASAAPSIENSDGTGAMAGTDMEGMHGMSGMQGMAMDLNDVAYDAFLANDRTLGDPQVVRIERGGRVLLRVINASASSNFWLDLMPARANLVAVDGRPVAPVSGSGFPVAMAQRLDLEIEFGAGQTVLPVFATLEGERRRTGFVLATAQGQVPKLSGQASKATKPVALQLEGRLRASDPLAVKTADRVHRVDLTGDMASYVWTLNGVAHGDDKPLMVARGQRVEIVMSNKTMMSHPMHLHGHSFQVVAIDGKRIAGALRDTVLVPPMSSVTAAFEADNPGRWAFHCHNLYHMEAGMMTTVEYETI